MMVQIAPFLSLGKILRKALASKERGSSFPREPKRPIQPRERSQALVVMVRRPVLLAGILQIAEQTLLSNARCEALRSAMFDLILSSEVSEVENQLQ